MNHPTYKPHTVENPQQLVIFLHGYGANGEDLLSLAPHFERVLPQTVFVAPNAFTPFPGRDGSYLWFDLGDMEPELMARHCDAVRAQGIALIQDLQKAYGIGPENTILIGFSQGTMMALSCALGHPNLVRAVIGLSGGLYMDPHFIIAAPHDLNIHLIHGEEDEVVPFEASLDTANLLDDLGFKVELCLIPHMDHEINQDVIYEVQTFLGGLGIE
jgi:phospholipase/carboxylesterase